MGFYKPSAQQLALACGTAGAYVDVTDDLITDTISGFWGRTSGFSDTRPGVFSFDLVNDTGKYTPGNASSTLATKVRVGMGVHHIVDGVHFGGTIRSTQPYFTGPAGLAGSSKIRVTCDDMLGNAARHALDSVGRSLVLGAGPILYYPLDDTALPAREYFGAAQMDGGPGAAEPSTGPWDQSGIVFGVDGPVGDTQVRFTMPASLADQSIGAVYNGMPISYPAGGLGTFGCWISPSPNGTFIEYSNASTPFFGVLITAISSLTRASINVPGIGSPVNATGAALTSGPSSWVEAEVTYSYSAPNYTYTVNLYSNGSLLATATSGTTTQFPAAVAGKLKVYVADGVAGDSATFSHLSWTARRVPMTKLVAPTEATLLEAFAAMVPEITLDTLPAGLSSAPLGAADTDGQAALDAFNDVIRTEQGSIWCETTGTLLSPTSKIKIRERARPATVDAAHTFSISEILNAPQFTTDIEDMVWAATASGPVTSQTTTDSTLIPYVGSASDSTRVLLRDPIDLLAWAQDRLLRGKATDVRLPQFTIDALQINRWTDVSTFRAGDRIRVSVPLAQLGVSYVDGWLTGCSYSLQYPSLQGEDQMLFTFALQPVLAAGGIYDTSVYDTATYAF